jgi:transposase
VYGSMEPELLVRLVGQAPIGATLYELQKLRCNLCGEVFTARAPEGVGEEKYDATSAAMIALLKYGSGLPFHRLEGLQAGLGIPLPASTQWGIVSEMAAKIRPAFEELARVAAQGEVVYNDDTSAKILAKMKRRVDEDTAAGHEEKRTGMFTSGIASTREGRQIALFFTGSRHAGENLADLLAKRAKELPPPIQMCDALSRNLPRDLQTVVANCLAHSRRKYVEVASNFPDECRYVLETLRDVYHNDELARTQGLTPGERLAFHQAHSEPLMKQLEAWLKEQIDEHKAEPNSGLGEAITYMQVHWKALTLFLRMAGAPLDNNLCERILKKAILHRKNALFYKTERGAQVADLFMSLIHTTELVSGNPFDYLTALQKHAEELIARPAEWMPWNYRETIGRLAASPT